MSSAWKYFDKNNDKNEIKCKNCPKVYKCHGSTTSSLLYHLRKIHNINVESCKDGSEKSEMGPIDKYVKKSCMDTIGETICRSLAEDGMSVNTIRKSKIINEYFKFRGFTMPCSNSTIWNHVEKYFLAKKAEVIGDLKNIISGNGRLSISVDEWTDISHYKYLNVTLRSYNSKESVFNIHNLGVEEIAVKGTAENIHNLISNKLNEFGISFERDVVGSTHDGAAVMRKYGEQIPSVSQLCINHAIHLSVVDTLYSNKDVAAEESDDESDSECDNDSEVENQYDINNDLQLKLEIKAQINKLRKIVKLFNKSSHKQNILQKYVVEQEGNEVRLIHDVKHRWSSLSKMIESFARIYKCINHALIDFGLDPFTDNEVLVLSNLNKTLKPLDIAIKELGKDSASLIELEGILTFLFQSLEKNNNNFSKDLIKRLKVRINERRIKPLNTLALFLNSGNYPMNNSFLKYSTKSETKEYANALFLRLFHEDNDLNDSSDLEITDSEICDDNILLSKLNQSINNIKKLKNKDDFSNIDDDLHYLEKSKKRTEKLDLLFSAILTVMPTSIISERAFSSSAFIKNKTNNRLKAKKLNYILFLKDYFKRN